jgi:hypothetical protein
MSDINEVPVFAAQQMQAGGNIGSKCLRIKNWSERTADEKLDALREHIEVLTHRLQYAETLLQSLRFHQHSPSGELVVYLERIGNRIEPFELRLPSGLRG